MLTRLPDAIGKKDAEAATEVSDLFKELLRGWSAMPQEIKEANDLSQLAS
jgi:flagellin-specific chaperone FliS